MEGELKNPGGKGKVQDLDGAGAEEDVGQSGRGRRS